MVQLLMAMGYGGTHGDGQHLGGSGDGGFDGVINQDPLGLGRVYVQAKRYAPDNIVGLSKASSAASMRRARAKGRVGRPKALTPQAQKAVVDLRNQGKAIAEIAASRIPLNATLFIGQLVILLVLLVSVVRASCRRWDLAAVLATVLAGVATAIYVGAEGVRLWPVMAAGMSARKLRDDLDPELAQAAQLSRDGLHAPASVLLGMSVLLIAWLLAKSDLWGRWVMSGIAAKDSERQAAVRPMLGAIAVPHAGTATGTPLAIRPNARLHVPPW